MMMMMMMMILILSLVLIPWSCFLIFGCFVADCTNGKSPVKNHDWTLSGMRPVEVEQRLSGGSFWQRENLGTWNLWNYAKVRRKYMKWSKLHPRNLTARPLKNDGWKMSFLLGASLFFGAMLNFWGGGKGHCFLERYAYSRRSMVYLFYPPSSVTKPLFFGGGNPHILSGKPFMNSVYIHMKIMILKKHDAVILDLLPFSPGSPSRPNFAPW